MLYNYGGLGDFYDGSKSALNRDEHVGTVARAALNTMRKIGVDDYLHFTRSGRRGLDNPSYDDKRFANSIRNIALTLLQSGDGLTNNTRYAHDIYHQ